MTFFAKLKLAGVGFFFLFLFVHPTAFAKITLQIDPPHIQVDEPFRLIFTLDGTDNIIPDFSPLQKDFTIEGTERSMSYSIVNGQAHSVNQWIIVLSANKAGTLTIPAIRIGKQQSQATTIEVSEAGETNEPKSADNDLPQAAILLQSTVNQSAPYVNQEIIYTVKLLNSQRLLDAEYQPPQVADALLIPLGSGRRYQTTLHGQTYAVEEQRYAVSPQKSGELKIIGPQFKALVADIVPKRVKVKGKTIRLQVKPVPATFNGQVWLPSSEVTITQSVEKKMPLAVGDTLTRTVTIEAVGIPAELLPTVEIAKTTDFNVYLGKPALKNKIKQGELLGTKTVQLTYVLKKPGAITLPPIEIPWFNIQANQTQTAVAPAETIQVGGEEALSNTGSTTALLPKQDKKAAVRLHNNHLINGVLPGHFNNASLAWGIAGLFALAWIITLLRGRKRSAIKRKRQALKKLKTACLNNSPHLAQIALLKWARLHWPEQEILNLHQLATLAANPELKKQLLILSEALYSKEKKAQWRGKLLWLCIQRYTKPTKPTTKKAQQLPPLNP